MLRKLVALTVVFGVVMADPIAAGVQGRMLNAIALDSPEPRTDAGELILQLLPDKVQLIINLLCTIIGVKMSAMSLAVKAITWVVSNVTVIIVGVLGALGFCKFTGKCVLDYGELIPVGQLRSFASPENLNTAQNFLFTAIEKYAEGEGNGITR